MGVVFSFLGSLSLDCYHFDFLMILKETLTFLSLSNPVLQYTSFYPLYRITSLLYVTSLHMYISTYLSYKTTYVLQKTNTAISNYNQSHHLFINKPTSDLIFNYMQSDFVVDNLQIWDAKIEFLRACALLPPAPGMFKLRLHSWQSMRMTILCFNLFVFLLSLTDIDGLFHAY